ncbi:hypothetical protein [Streptomyces sp. NPDC020607]|uniref:hypothetical protein n=1 Tax=Streptomyces sp. NPDC020607 TaxID=3365082 RepID=UPI00378FD2DB
MTGPANAAAAGDTPGQPAPDKPKPECTHWVGAEKRHCKEADGVRQYLPGPRCPLHTPAALQGKPEPPTGPGWPIHRQEAP